MKIVLTLWLLRTTFALFKDFVQANAWWFCSSERKLTHENMIAHVGVELKTIQGAFVTELDLFMRNIIFHNQKNSDANSNL